MAYYTCGCISWQWYYPYNYGPFLSDMTELEQLNSEIQFELGNPFKPFQQLLSCLPPSSSNLLPSCYHQLMHDTASPLKEYYPESIVIDMHGERQSWLGVVLLPFIDVNRLIDTEYMYECNRLLNEEEKRRNSFGSSCIYFPTSSVDVDEKLDDGEMRIQRINFKIQPGEAFKAQLLGGTKPTLPGFEDSVQGAHGRADHIHTNHNQPTQICFFFQRGACKKGKRCRFLHESDDNGDFVTAESAVSQVEFNCSNSGSNSHHDNRDNIRQAVPSARLSMPMITDEMLDDWCENG